MDFNALFSQKNTVDRLSEKDIQQTHGYIELVKAFSRITYQSIYLIDYQAKSFEFVSDNPLFLAGLTAKEVMEMGYGFYQKYVPSDDFQMLIKINEAGFSFYEKIPIEERKLYVISYDFQIQNAHNKRPLQKCLVFILLIFRFLICFLLIFVIFKVWKRQKKLALLITWFKDGKSSRNSSIRSIHW